jgi:hypothetical protein
MSTQLQEQSQLRADLVRKYGEKTFERALEMSGIRQCLQALACDELSKEERQHAYVMASLHLAKLHASFVTLDESTALTECCRRLDSALDLWIADDIEQRDGLPPAPATAPRL